ncbi:MAG: hypothetical protein WCW68_14450 [Methanothrix sp.]
MNKLYNFRLSTTLYQAFEAKIKAMNESAGRGAVLTHGDKTRCFADAIRMWINHE